MTAGNNAAQPAKMILVANNFPPIRGGSAVVYENLARHAGGEIVVLAPRRNYLDGLPMIGWREHDRRAPFRVVRCDLLRTLLRTDGVANGHNPISFLASDLWIRARLVLTVLQLLHRTRAKTICVGEALSSSWLLTLLRVLIRLGLRLRLIVYVHGEEITTEDSYDPGQKRCRAALYAADRIVVVSQFTYDVVLRLLGHEMQSRMCLIENGVDTTRFQPGERRADLIEKYRLDGCFVFVSVCRLLEKKGMDNTIRAFAKLSPQMPDARYLIVGTGPFEDELRQLVVTTGLEDRVTFAGSVTENELVGHYRLGDVFIMPNRKLPNGDTEGFGLVFLEANACGLPVIAGQDGGSTDAVQDGKNGLIVDGQSVEAIARAMLRLYQDVELRGRISASGLETARKAAWETKTRRLLELSSA